MLPLAAIIASQVTDWRCLRVTGKAGFPEHPMPSFTRSTQAGSVVGVAVMAHADGGAHDAVTHGAPIRLSRSRRIFSQLFTTVPGIVGLAAALVGIVGGVAALIPSSPPSDPFGEPRYSESFTFPFSDPERVREHVDDIWIDADQNDIWTSEIDVEHGLFRMANQEDQNAVRYRWIRYRGSTDEVSDRPVSVDVRVSQTGTRASSAGLMYRWSTSTKTYYAFLVSADGNYSFVERQPSGGLLPILTERSEKIRVGDWNKIGILTRGDQLDLYINDTKMRTLSVLNLPPGDSGIIATSTGVFEFDNYQIFE